MHAFGVRLHLPAAKIAAVVGQNQFEIAHGRNRILHGELASIITTNQGWPGCSDILLHSLAQIFRRFSQYVDSGNPKARSSVTQAELKHHFRQH